MGGNSPIDPVVADSSCSGGAPCGVPEVRVLSKRSDFLAANRGIRVSRPGFVLLARDNSGPDGEGARSDPGLRFGITVTKRIGNAVVRNRMKRRFRALLRELLPSHGLPAHDHVLIGREGGVERDFALLRGELIAAFERARAGKGDPPRGPRNKGSRNKGSRNKGPSTKGGGNKGGGRGQPRGDRGASPRNPGAAPPGPSSGGPL